MFKNYITRILSLCFVKSRQIIDINQSFLLYPSTRNQGCWMVIIFLISFTNSAHILSFESRHGFQLTWHTTKLWHTSIVKDQQQQQATVSFQS